MFGLGNPPCGDWPPREEPHTLSTGSHCIMDITKEYSGDEKVRVEGQQGNSAELYAKIEMHSDGGRHFTLFGNAELQLEFLVLTGGEARMKPDQKLVRCCRARTHIIQGWSLTQNVIKEGSEESLLHGIFTKDEFATVEVPVPQHSGKVRISLKYYVLDNNWESSNIGANIELNGHQVWSRSVTKDNDPCGVWSTPDNGNIKDHNQNIRCFTEINHIRVLPNIQTLQLRLDGGGDWAFSEVEIKFIGTTAVCARHWDTFAVEACSQDHPPTYSVSVPNARDGGSILVHDTATLSASFVTFEKSYGTKGGCLYAGGQSTIILSNVIFSECYAEIDGGGLYAGSALSADPAGTTARSFAGDPDLTVNSWGTLTKSPSIKITRTEFERNTVGENGAGIFIDGGSGADYPKLCLIQVGSFDNMKTDLSPQQIYKKENAVLGFERSTDCPGGVACPPNTIAEDSNQFGQLYVMNEPFTTCKKVIYPDPCRAGKYTTNVGSAPYLVRECEDCPTGRYGDSDGFCDGRAEYSNLTDGARHPHCSCRECPAGYTSVGDPTSRTLCLQCRAGKYGSESSQHFGNCKECIAGKFNDETGQVDCKPCEKGKYSTLEGVSTPSDCTECAAGKYSTLEGAATADVCENCPAGKYTDEKGGESESHLCKPCVLGRFRSHANYDPTTCTECERGTFNDDDAIGATACKVCLGGRYREVENGKSEDDCERCGTGRYLDDAGTDRLEHDEKSDCKACNRSTYNSEEGSVDSLDCKPCVVGKYQNLDAQASCKLCELGHYQAEQRQTECLECAHGTFGDEVGSASDTSCKVCPAGYWSNKDGSGERLWPAFCQHCSPGKYSNAIGQTANPCGYCPPGKFADGVSEAVSSVGAATYCSYCKEQTIMPDYMVGLAVSCTNCPRPICFPGDDGYPDTCDPYAPPTVGGTVGGVLCSGCREGRFGFSQGCMHANVTAIRPSTQTTIARCTFTDSSRDNYRYQNDTDGTACHNDGGTFELEDCVNSEPCTDCPAGWFAGAGDKRTCTACPRGWFGDTRSTDSPLSRSDCHFCEVGKYGSYDIECTAGTIPGEEGKSCFPSKYEVPTLLVGTVYRDNNATHWNRLVDNKAATPFWGGSDSGMSGPANFENWTCIACGRGRFGRTLGAYEVDACEDCPEGRWSAALVGNQISTCAFCQPGYYDDPSEPGSRDRGGRIIPCVGCPQGYFSASLGALECTPCAPGFVTGTHVFEHLWTYVDRTNRGLIDMTEFMDVIKLAKDLDFEDKFEGTFPNATDITAIMWRDIQAFATDQNASIATTGDNGLTNTTATDDGCLSTCEGEPSNCTNMKEDFLAPGKCAANCSDAFKAFVIAAFCPPLRIITPAIVEDWLGERHQNLGLTNIFDPEHLLQKLVGTSKAKVNMTTCESCVPGMFQGAYAGDACSNCEQGRFTKVESSAECKDCPTGFYQNEVGTAWCRPW